MNPGEVFFFLFGAAVLVSAFFVVTATNVVRAALWLVGALLGVAALYLLLGAGFLGWVQVLVYVGAIVVLILFGLMVTRAPIGRQRLETGEWWLGAGVSLVLLLLLSFIAARAFPGARISLEGSALTGTGLGIFNPRYVLPFELVSLLLLAALVGAILLARREQ